MRRLIVTNGDEAVRHLAAVGVGGTLLAWRDILYEGPVPAGLDLAALSAVRARYLAATYPVRGRDIPIEFTARDAMITGHAAFDDIVLVFDACLSDTLQAVQVLDALADNGRDPASMRILQTDRSLGAIGPKLATMVASAPAVGRARSNKARATWAAWRAPTPEAWLAMLNADRNMRHVWLAVLQSTKHLPQVRSGVTGVEQLVLDAVGSSDMAARDVYTSVAQRMDVVAGRYFTDWSLWTVLTRLASARVPLIAGVAGRFPYDGDAAAQADWLGARLSLTAFGRGVLAGDMDHAALNAFDFWFGGTHVTAHNLWRICDQRHRLLPPGRSEPASGAVS